MMGQIIKQGNFKTDGNWWEKKVNLRFTTNRFNILFSQSHRNNAEKFYIVSYNIRDLENTFNKLNEYKETHVFVNSKFIEELKILAKKYPKIQFYHHPEIHLKLYMNDSGKIIFGSQNFNNSGWVEGLFEIKDKDFFNLLYKKYIQKLFQISYRILVMNDGGIYSGGIEVGNGMTWNEINKPTTYYKGYEINPVIQSKFNVDKFKKGIDLFLKSNGVKNHNEYLKKYGKKDAKITA